jgi:hypothetical protein
MEVVLQHPHDRLHGGAVVVLHQMAHVLEKDGARSLGGDDLREDEEHVPAVVRSILEAQFVPSLTERLTRESSAEDVVVWYGGGLYLSDVVVEAVALKERRAQLRVIPSVGLAGSLVDLGCEDALSTESVQREVKTSNASEEIYEAERHGRTYRALERGTP